MDLSAYAPSCLQDEDAAPPERLSPMRAVKCDIEKAARIQVSDILYGGFCLRIETI